MKFKNIAGITQKSKFRVTCLKMTKRKIKTEEASYVKCFLFVLGLLYSFIPSKTNQLKT